jgi:hypothetical protein
MATSDSGKAARTRSSTTTTRSTDRTSDATATDRNTPSDPMLEPMGDRMAEGQRIAHEAQQMVAKRTPLDVPDIGKTMGEEGAGQLSEWEKRQTGTDAQPVSHEDQVMRAGLTPAEKAERAKEETKQ